jgi:hypothetical protein
MPESLEVGNVARASILAPPGLRPYGDRRVHVYLRPTPDGRFRWFHEDGSPTVVDGATVDAASRVARLVWRESEIEVIPPAAAAR